MWKYVFEFELGSSSYELVYDKEYTFHWHKKLRLSSFQPLIVAWIWLWLTKVVWYVQKTLRQIGSPKPGIAFRGKKKKSVVAISQKKIINEISSAIKKNTYFYFRCIRNCLPLLSPSIPSFFILQDIHNDPSENANKPSHGIAYHQRWFPFSPVKNQRGHKWKTCQSFLKLTRSSIKIGPNMHNSISLLQVHMQKWGK